MKRATDKTALVIGGSMAGLLTARVLSDHFQQVILVERDRMNSVPESRKGQPQTRHLHGLLARGFQIMCHYFPDLPQSLEEEGALIVDMAETMRWYCYGGYRSRFTFGMKGVISDRPFLECQVRRRVFALPNVQVLDGTGVVKLCTTEDRRRITGVEIKQEGQQEKTQNLQADLVVDCSGRGSHSMKWLTELGYSKPPESVVSCGTGYATRMYYRDPDEPSTLDWIFITPEAPKESRAGGALPVEGNRWIVSLGGWHGDHAPKDEAGFLEFARSLPAPDLYNLIRRSRPLSDISVYKYPASMRRHYEKLSRFPEGYLILGDALCSFNPLYGQGMTSAALQAAALDKLLQEHGGVRDGMAGTYFKRVSRIIDIPWQTAVGEDFRFPETKGKKAPGTDIVNAYIARIHRATHQDTIVGSAFLRVMNMMEPPASLFHPRILWRVLFPKKPELNNLPPRPERQPAEV